MKQLGYYFMLVLRYRKKHLLETIYSLLAITISVILCYCSITVGFTLMNYGYEAVMIEQHGCEMEMDGFPVGAASIDGEDEWKPEDYRRMKKKLDALPEVRETYLKKGYSEYTDDDGNDKKELYYQLYVGAKDTSDLNGCAKQIEKDTGYAVRVNSEIATHLGQGTEEDSMARSAGNAIVAMIGALFASFVMLVIRNTMMLPVLERMKEYGVLRCVGMSKRQLSFMLAVEGVLLTLLSTVLGTAIGFALLRSCQGWINDCLMLRVPVRFHFYPLAVLYSCLLCIGVTLLALMEPARQAGNRSVQETLRGGVYGIRTGSGKKKSGRHTISHLFGRIFGVEWEYAARNMTRNPGNQIYMFIGLFISMVLFSVVFSSVETTYSTYENSMQGTHVEYTEAIEITGDCSVAEKKKICQDVSKLKGVKKTGLYSPGILHMPDYGQKKHFKNAEDADSWYSYVTAIGYDRDHLDGLKGQIVSGAIDYDKMVKENGIVLCDYKYNPKDEDGNVVREDVRLTDYKVGDTFPVLTNEAGNRVAGQLRMISGKLGKEPTLSDNAWLNKKSREYRKYEKNLERYWKKAGKLIEKNGYPLQKYKKMIKAWGNDYVVGIYNMKMTLEQIKVDRGNVVRLPIQAIIMEDTYNSAYLTEQWLQGGNSVGVLMADKTYDLYSTGKSSYFSMNSTGDGVVFVGIERDIRQAGKDLAAYIKELNNKSIDKKYVLVSDANGSGDLDWYQEDKGNTNREMELLEKGGAGIGAFILFVCLLQIFNVTAAGMTMRREEFYLLSVAGMSKGQMRKMLILEKAITCFFGILTGVCAGYGLSYLFLETFLNQDGGFADGTGGICFSWPAGKILITAGIVYVLCLLSSLGKQRKEG